MASSKPPSAAPAPPAVNAKADRHFVTALARGLDVLSAFRSRDRMLGNQELARRCGLPKSTISRLTYTLTKHGYLEHAEDGSGNTARPLMQELADHSHAMVSLGLRDRLSMIYVDNCRSESALTLSLDVGSRIPRSSCCKRCDPNCWRWRSGCRVRAAPEADRLLRAGRFRRPRRVLLREMLLRYRACAAPNPPIPLHATAACGKPRRRNQRVSCSVRPGSKCCVMWVLQEVVVRRRAWRRNYRGT
jgi:hypothetical protein